MTSNESLKRSDKAAIKALRAKPCRLVAKWSVSPPPPFPPLALQQEIIDEMALYLNYEILMAELRAHGMEALQHFNFEQLDKIADAYPDLAVKLADPNLTGLRDHGDRNGNSVDSSS